MLHSIRFSHDRPTELSNSGSASKEEQAEFLTGLLHRSVRVRPEIFPGIADVVRITEERLLGCGVRPDVFVHADTNMQACCFAPARYDHPVILVTSAMVERLTSDELASVIGHEIGHSVYRHQGQNCEGLEGAERLKVLADIRSSEISADRVGLLACRDVKTAISALIKTSTGLSSEHIRFDIQGFMQQFKELTENGPNMNEAMSTHPLFLLRIRALISFSNSKDYYRIIGQEGKGSLSLDEVNRSVLRDLRKISGLSLDDLDNEIILRILVLASFAVFAADGKFSKDEQEFFQETFGDLDTSAEMQIVQDKGVSGIVFELRRLIALLGGVSDEDRRRMKTFFSVLEDSFPRDHTQPLRVALNSMGYI